MPYCLLTGATGLLGTYLLRDALCEGRQMAVLVRRNLLESASQRIESALARWERDLDYPLARPPVLEGDLTQPDLGLDRAAIDWLSKHCDCVLHNAADLSFQANQASGEPYRTNVQGTGHVLELCRKAGIRRFHYVSTAYVSGLRKGRILESELDVGQESANDYERSKIQSESLVQAAEFLDLPTVYRPSIIIGDSLTGYSTTFHSFYAPLKLGQAVVDRMHLTEIEGAPFMAALGLTGQERKHFVPVDWVSRVITYLVDRPECHGKTYHLTPLAPVPVATSCKVLECALREYARDASRTHVEAGDLEELQKTFASQMDVYRMYWRDDPEFDCTNTLTAAPHLPCPEVDFEMLMQGARFALRVNFGWPRPRPVIPEFDVGECLGPWMGRSSNGRPRPDLVRVGLQVNGPGGGQWTLLVDSARPVAAEMGLDAEPADLVYLNSKTFQQCIRRELTPREAAERGRIAAESHRLSTEQLLRVLEATTAEAADDLVDHG